MSEQSLQIIERGEVERYADVAPVISIEQAIQRHRMLSNYVSQVMQEGHDFGAIPGTGSKPTLLKPGAEKLTTLFGLTKRLFIVEKTEDWTGRDDGEAFFYYLYRCALYRGEFLIAEADGSCNSRESKYRWREAQRKCPACGVAAIIKGRAEYGGGWICFGKKGGCGAKYADDSPLIMQQQTGRIANPEIADQVNTIQKMAAKRALIAATLLAVNASEFFTQDVEDFPQHIEQPPAAPEPPPPPPKPTKPSPQVIDVEPETVHPSPLLAAPAPASIDDAAATIKRIAWECKFAANPSHWRQFELGLLGCSIAEASAAMLSAARDAMQDAALNPVIISWNSETWPGTPELKVYVMGLIIAHAQADGFKKTKAIVGEPAKKFQVESIELMIGNLLSWLGRPQMQKQAA
jgi:hypothetical protein